MKLGEGAYELGDSRDLLRVLRSFITQSLEFLLCARAIQDPLSPRSLRILCVSRLQGHSKKKSTLQEGQVLCSF